MIQPRFFDPEAEAALLGCCLISAQACDIMLETIVPPDFGMPKYQYVAMAIAALHTEGQSVDAVSVLHKLAGMDKSVKVDGIDLVSLNTGTVSRVRTYVDIVAGLSLRRRLHNEATELQQAVADLNQDPAESLKKAQERLAEIDSPILGSEPADESFEEFLARTTDKPPPWLVEDLIREGWRTVVVAAEGIGKSWLLRQFAVGAAYGVHPLRFKPVEPVPVLLLDLENPEDHLHASLARMVGQAKRTSGQSGQGRLFHRMGGVDLRKRSDRVEIDNLIKKRKPKLVIAGPVYKLMGHMRGNETWENAAREVQTILDDWRERYGLSYLLEDHAPKKQPGSKRDLVPYGSSLWLRWPEVGIGLEPQKDESLLIKRWRGDRMPTDWPQELRRGDAWPWVGQWATSREDF